MYERQPDYEEPEYDMYRSRPNDLQTLDRLDNWQLAEYEPDIRGWNVVDANGNQAGNIDSLLASPEAQEVIFVVIAYGGVLGIGGSKTLVPMDLLDLDQQSQRAVYRGDADDLKDAPGFTDDTRDFRPFYDYWWSKSRGMVAEGMTPERRVSGRTIIPEVEEQLEVGKRTEQTGEVVIRKEVETKPETVRQPVTRTRVRIYRTDVEPGREVQPGERALKEGETLRIPIVEEKLVVEKHPVVTGEVVVQPETVSEEEQVTKEVRREHVAVETRGDVDVDEEESARARHE